MIEYQCDYKLTTYIAIRISMQFGKLALVVPGPVNK